MQRICSVCHKPLLRDEGLDLLDDIIADLSTHRLKVEVAEIMHTNCEEFDGYDPDFDVVPERAGAEASQAL